MRILVLLKLNILESENSGFVKTLSFGEWEYSVVVLLNLIFWSVRKVVLLKLNILESENSGFVKTQYFGDWE